MEQKFHLFRSTCTYSFKFYFLRKQSFWKFSFNLKFLFSCFILKIYLNIKINSNFERGMKNKLFIQFKIIKQKAAEHWNSKEKCLYRILVCSAAMIVVFLSQHKLWHNLTKKGRSMSLDLAYIHIYLPCNLQNNAGNLSLNDILKIRINVSDSGFTSKTALLKIAAKTQKKNQISM